jgi:hypothetical protein
MPAEEFTTSSAQPFDIFYALDNNTINKEFAVFFFLAFKQDNGMQKRVPVQVTGALKMQSELCI